MHIREEASPALQRAMDMASERGASIWLTVLPLDEHCFALHKQALEMPSPCDMAGFHQWFQHTVPVVNRSPSNIRCHAQRVGTLPYGTTS